MPPQINVVQNPWNSLEIAKLTISAATPIVVGFLGIVIHRATKSFEHKQWKNQKLVEKKIRIYEEMCPILNDILCYFNVSVLGYKIPRLSGENFSILAEWNIIGRHHTRSLTSSFTLYG
jgi:hypothetical protein